MRVTFTACLLLLFFAASAQKIELEYSLVGIPENLKEGANAVLREQVINVEVSSRKSVTVKTRRVVTVLNEYGLSRVGAGEYGDVRSISATVYNAFGMETRKYKSKDFRKVAVSEGAIISDNVHTFLDFTPTQYPFTMVYESEVSSSNTAFLPRWFPVSGPYLGIQKSQFTIRCESGLGFKYKEYNFDSWNIVKSETVSGLTFTAENIAPMRYESYAPSASKYLPMVLFGLEKFNLEGVEGDATNWQSMGNWIYNSLLAGRDELSEETKTRIRSLVGDEKDPIKKAKIVYKYVQDKTRYVGIQLGIGGWRPMKAKDVDRLGYGDCKALTNYTRCLLDAVGVPSYYSKVFGDDTKTDFQEDFVSMQGNHIILAIPTQSGYTWLECTSQVKPFGFLGDFTDDRLVLVIKPTGGEIVRTTTYNENTQRSKGRYELAPDGMIRGNLEIRSKGIQFDDRMHLSFDSADDRKKFYQNYFGINNLRLDAVNISKNDEAVELLETIVLNAERYGEPRGNRLFFPVNAFNKILEAPQRYRSRKAPMEIERPSSDYDEITVDLPEGFSVEAKPDNAVISDKFGEYRMEYEMIGERQLRYKRTFTLKDGYYKSEEYENFRKFMDQVVKADNSKIVLVKT